MFAKLVVTIHKNKKINVQRPSACIGDAQDGNDDGGVVIMTIYLLVVMKMVVLVI